MVQIGAKTTILLAKQCSGNFVNIERLNKLKEIRKYRNSLSAKDCG
jgi:hypothetical protein